TLKDECSKILLVTLGSGPTDGLPVNLAQLPTPFLTNPECYAKPILSSVWSTARFVPFGIILAQGKVRPQLYLNPRPPP
ncbi:hypothetical protein PanWU01x14_307730, partial [Parasponia andersonii]